MNAGSSPAMERTAPAMPSSVEAFLRFVRPKGEPIEVQALGAKEGRPVELGAVTTPEHLTSVLKDADARGAEGVYVIPSLLRAGVEHRREMHRLAPLQKGASTTDSDIAERTMLYIDADSERPKKISATEEQLAAAHALAGDVDDLLTSVGVPGNAIGRGCSGNGEFLGVALDGVAATDGTVEDILHALALLLNRPGAKIDTATSDAKRLIPAPPHSPPHLFKRLTRRTNPS